MQVYDPLQPTRGIGVIEAESNGAMGVEWDIYATEKVMYVLGARPPPSTKRKLLPAYLGDTNSSLLVSVKSNEYFF